MSIEKIRMFVTICEEGSASRAAEVLHITQPAITQGLKDLELDLGVLLFERVGRRLELNEEGHRFLKEAQIALASYDKSIEMFKSSAKTLRIGSTLTIASTLLAGAISNYEKSNDVSCEISCKNKASIMMMLEENKLDLAFVEGYVEMPGYKYYVLGKFHLCALASKIYIETTDKQEYSYVVRELGSTYRNMFDRYFEYHNISPKIKWTCTENAIVYDAIVNSQGIGILPIEYIADKSDDLVILENTMDMSEVFGLVVKENREYKSYITNFITDMIQYFEK